MFEFFIAKKHILEKKKQSFIGIIGIMIGVTVLGALGYLIAPVDFIPDLIPGMGFVDDIGALTVVIKKMSEHIDDKIKNQAKEKLQTWFKNIDDIKKFL